MDTEVFDFIYTFILKSEQGRDQKKLRGIQGRPRADLHDVLKKVLWVLTSGARWKDLPRAEGEPSYQSCHKRFQSWVDSGIFIEMLEAVSKKYFPEKPFLSDCYIDGSFSSAKKGAIKSDLQSEERALKLWPLSLEGVYLSPLLWQALRRTKPSLLKRR